MFDHKEYIASLPRRPGVYHMYGAAEELLYVGKAASLRSRVRSYFQESRPRDPKTDALVRQIRDLEYIVTYNELEALMLEANLVRRHRPRYNIILRDDKHYPFLKLTTNEEFPRLLVARKVQRDGARYYGPFYPATAMRETLRLTRQLFPLRTCSITIDGKLERPCIQYAIHRCNAPCTGWETREGYARTVAPFLASHCQQCHGGTKVKGQFRLSTDLGHDFLDAAAADRWRSVAGLLAGQEMHPRDRPRPQAKHDG